MDGVKLSFEKEVFEFIVDKAIEFKLGARGLRAICEAIMIDVMFDIPSTDEKNVKITLQYAKEKLAKANIQRLKAA
jgi:ATP-dependent Clp protease ATP-binding subunit ClpX